MDFVTSDTHFGHKNIIEYCNRPFKDVKEMDEFMIDAWNSRINKDDIVYHLGDFCMFKRDYKRVCQELNGRIILLRGNHDIKNLKGGIKSLFDDIKDVYEYRYKDIRIWMSHYCHLSWPHQIRGSLHFFGHDHGSLSNPPQNSIDVGVDNLGYSPYTISEVVEMLMGSK